MHCADPGCLRACPADGAIVQYQNGIVDFQQENCIGCQYCVTGCPFNIPKFNSQTKKVLQVHALLRPRVAGLEPACIKACPTGCLHFGTKEDMNALAENRAAQLREHTSHKNAGVYDPPGVGGTQVIYVLHDIPNPEAYGGLPANPQHSAAGAPLEGAAEVARQTGDDRRDCWDRSATTCDSAPRKLIQSRRFTGHDRDEPVSATNQLRTRSDRALHAARARDALDRRPHVPVPAATGLALLLAAPVLDRRGAGRRPDDRGSGIRGSGCCSPIAVVWMHRIWRAEMRTTAADRDWNRKVEAVHREPRRGDASGRPFQPRPEAVLLGDAVRAMILLLISGIVMWFPEYVPRGLRLSRQSRSSSTKSAALITIGAFIIHVYMGLFVVPGGFRAIVHGYVSPGWAKMHHRLWYDRLTGSRAGE